jgi:hypothetical protein
MNFREVAGLVLMTIGAALIPVAWMTSRRLWVIAGVVFIIGAFLFYTKRMHARAAELEKEGGSSTSGTGVPADIHNYSGWRTGGYSETMDGADE